ncbi:MAG: hypothetical protein RL660_2155 [Bacteroidota bacterium]|jgi:hypothetical protein
MFARIVIVCFLLSIGTSAFAQKKYNKHAQHIESLLEHQKVDEALRELELLVKKYPGNQYYAEMQLSVLQQVIEKIKYVQEDQDILAQEADAIPKHLQAPVKPDTAKLIIANDALTVDSSFDDIFIDTANAIPSKPQEVLSAKEKRKRDRRQRAIEREFELAAEIGAVVTIDSNLRDDAFRDNQEEGNSANSAASAAPDSETKSAVNALEDPIGYVPLSTKVQRDAKRRQKVIDYYAAKDRRIYERMLIDAAREISLSVENCDSAAAILYRHYVDTFAKTVKYNQAAIDKVDEADERFLIMEYAPALTLYDEAMGIQPDYFEAYLKMAEAYAKLREDSMAVVYYKAAIELRPQSTAPYFAFANYWYRIGEFQESLDNTLQCILLYPERKFFSMWASIAQQTAHEFKSQWVPRPVFPILAGRDIDEILAEDKSPWQHYQAAKSTYGVYSDSTGIMRKNEISGEEYLEVNAWLAMLDSTKDLKQFEFARHMRKIGYLDCYVLVSLFHHDLYPQYEHLIKNHQKKVQAYLKMLSEWDSKKYDKIRAMPHILPPPPEEKKKEEQNVAEQTQQSEASEEKPQEKAAKVATKGSHKSKSTKPSKEAKKKEQGNGIEDVEMN